MPKRYDLAPLDGITRAVFRREWVRFFGGADRVFIPFFSPTREHVFTVRDRREFLPENNPSAPGVQLVPQVMTRSAPELVWAAELLRDMGYTEVNLNLGCPSGTVTAKGKGAGFLMEPDALDRFFDEAVGKLCLPLSVKARIGFFSPDEFPRLLDVFNRYPLADLIVHPRVAKGKYRAPLVPDALGYALAESRNPVCCNGDLRTVGEIAALVERFPRAEAVMVGRGAVADPALLRKCRGGPPASREELRRFTAALYRAYRDWYGQPNLAARRMREIWFYLIHLFDDTRGRNRAMRRFRSYTEYEAAEAAIFDDLPLRTDSAGELL